MIDQACRNFLRTPLHVLPFCNPLEIIESLDRQYYGVVVELLQELLLVKESSQQSEGVEQIRSLYVLRQQKHKS